MDLDRVQVLTPVKKGILGSGNLNVKLQEKFNPAQTGPRADRVWKYCISDRRQGHADKEQLQA